MTDWAKYGGFAAQEAKPIESGSKGTDWAKYGGFAGTGSHEPEESYARMAAQVPRNLAASVGDIADLPIAGINYLLEREHEKIRKAANKPGLKNRLQIPYVGNKIAEGIDYVTGGYTSPKTKRERFAEAGTRALGSLASGYGGGKMLADLGIKGLSKLGRGLAKFNPLNPTSAAATGAGAVAQQAYREDRPDDLLGTLGTGIAADMAVRTGLGFLNKRNYANALKIDPKKVETFKEAGLSPTLGQVSDNHLVKSTENIIKEVGLPSKLRETIGRQYESIMDTLGPGAQKLAYSELEAGKSIKKSMVDYERRVSDTTEKLKQRYMNKVEKSPIGDLVDVTDSLRYFKDLEHGLKTAQSRADLLKTPLGKQYQSLKSIALENKGKAPLPDLEEFRRKVFDEISKGEIGSVSRGRLMQLRSKVNQDIEHYMEHIGASNEWNKYNDFYSRYAAKRKPHLTQAKELPDFEANKLFEGIGHSGKLDRSLLDSVYASQKKSGQKETMDALIQKMGTNGNEYDVHLFAKRFSKQAPETKESFLKPLSAAMRKKFEAVINSIDAIKELNKFGNPSRTAYTTAMLETGKIAPLAAINYFSGNDPSDAAWQWALLTAGSYAITHGAFANPKFINWAYKGTKLKTPKSKIHHIAGIKGILGRPFYQELLHSMGEKEQ